MAPLLAAIGDHWLDLALLAGLWIALARWMDWRHEVRVRRFEDGQRRGREMYRKMVTERERTATPDCGVQRDDAG